MLCSASVSTSPTYFAATSQQGLEGHKSFYQAPTEGLLLHGTTQPQPLLPRGRDSTNSLGRPNMGKPLSTVGTQQAAPHSRCRSHMSTGLDHQCLSSRDVEGTHHQQSRAGSPGQLQGLLVASTKKQHGNVIKRRGSFGHSRPEKYM